MRQFIGFLLVLGGATLGVYIGVWVCLVGGVVDFVDGAKETPVDSGLIAWGLVKFLIAGPVGAAVFWVVALPGVSFMASGSGRWRRTRIRARR